MHCTKCGAALKENAKFCTKCGQKVEAAAPQAEAPVQTEEPQELKEEQTSDISNVNGRICWNIQPGQVARVIDEAEMNSYGQLKGIIIQEGTRAYIRSNGRTIASISGGSYDLTPAPGQVVNEIRESVSSGWNYIINLFKRDKEPMKPDVHKEQQDLILKNARSNASFSVVIVLEKAFPLLIGRKRADLEDYKEILPMRISTQYLDVELILNAYFKISDHEKFILHYLTDRKSLNTTMIVHEISGAMRRDVQDSLYDKDLQSRHVPAELHALIKNNINEIAADTFFGISLVRIVEISLDNKDLDRFRALSAEMYLSEKELDYLKRTNDFKNRMADVVNGQRIHEARTELDLQRALDAINNDNLLHQDELERFKHVLANERRVHDATSDAERDAALNELYKSELLRKEDVDVLKMQIETNAETRNHALQMMRMRDGIEFERLRLEGETEKAIAIAQGELAKQGLYDEYADGRFYKEIEKKKAAANAELDIEQRKRDMDFNDDKRRHDMEREDDEAQFRQFMAMMGAEEQSKENERKHKEEMERMKWENAQTLSDDKVWALSGNDNAQYKYNADKEREKWEMLEAQRREEQERYDRRQREEQDRHERMQRESQDRFERMMVQMMAMNGGIQAQRDAEKEREIREKEERLQRQENRMDTAYDRALDYTTKNNVQQRPQQPAAGKVLRCPDCGAVVQPGRNSCDDCGSEIA